MRRFRRISRSNVVALPRGLLALSLILLACSVMAQEQTSRYIYDDDGRLRAVIAPNGEAAIYDYDSAGNFTAIRRLGTDALELLTFAPRSGVPGTRVVFQGIGFGAGVTAVTFGGGAAGALVGFTNNTITAIVPSGAVTGPVTINTARGTLTTTTPFVLQGITLNPAEVSVSDGVPVQFTATVIVPGDDQELSWSVNGVEGGSEALGTITQEGLYTPPLDTPATFTVSIQAVSLAFPTLAGTAIVHVRSLSDFRFTLSTGVSIGKGEGIALQSAFSKGISIGKGDPFSNASVFSRGVAVGKGAGFSNETFSPAISIGKGGVFSNPFVFSQGISIVKGFDSANTFSPAVMLTKGPVITSVSPTSMIQGTDGTLTLTGANFGGANGVRVLNPDGSDTFGVTVNNFSVGGGGTSLTVNLSVQGFAQVGRKIIVVTTPAGHSVRSDVNVNVIQITAP